MFPVSNLRDISTAMSIFQKPKSSERNKDINIKLHHVKELLKTGVVNFKDVPMEMQLADLLTKSATYVRLCRSRIICGLQNQFVSS